MRRQKPTRENATARRNAKLDVLSKLVCGGHLNPVSPGEHGCGHFLSIHGPRGCSARLCDCKAHDGKSVKGGGDA